MAKSALDVERNGINVIDEAERKGRPAGLFWPWCAANISVLGISYGAFLLGFGLNLWQALIAGILGTLASFLLVGLASLAGKNAGRRRPWCCRERLLGYVATLCRRLCRTCSWWAGKSFSCHSRHWLPRRFSSGSEDSPARCPRCWLLWWSRSSSWAPECLALTRS
nr:cytosine permease [Fodinicola feengrottensis]